MKENKDKVVNDLLKRISNLEFEVESKEKENERLDNIINKLEKWLEERSGDVSFAYHHTLAKLQELKGDDKE